MYGAFSAVVTALRDEVGSPYDLIPLGMMRYGEGGVVGWGSLCGAINGSSAAITLTAGEDYKKLVNELAGWYTQAAFPSDASNGYATRHEFLVKEYKSDKALAQSVSGSTLCHVSVTKWCLASGVAAGTPERAERCARLAGDVAAHAVELLNANADGKFKPAYSAPAAARSCQACHFKGKDFKAGQFTGGKENCTSCHEPHKL